MSSKIVPAAAAGRTAPVIWPTLEGPPGQASRNAVAETKDQDSARMAETQRLLIEARQAGFREGEAAAGSRLQAVIERLAESIGSISSLRSRLRREAEADLLRLAVLIARRILRRELAADPEAIGGVIKAALERLQGQEIHRVRIHPEHAAALRASLEQRGFAGDVDVLADPSQEPGGVVFETARGDLEASVETQLEEIERGLADRLRRRS